MIPFTRPGRPCADRRQPVHSQLSWTVSLHTDNPAALFPLAGSSRRRRRLITMRAAQQNVARRPASHRQSRVDSVRSAAPADLPVRLGRVGPLRDPERRIAERLLSGPPCTWLFAGESYLDDSADRAWPSLVDRFAHALRSRMNRPQDVVVDACQRGATLQEALADLDSRIMRRRPDVILLQCGFSESSDDSAQITDFESDLLAIIRICRAHGVQLVLGTCPLPARSDDDPDAIRQIVCNEAVRSIAAEWDLPLIDHSEEWDQFSIHPGLAGSWYEAGALLPGAIGHERICDSLVTEIMTWQAVAGSPTNVPTYSQ